MDDLIVYQNDGTEVTTDSFTLHLSDGKFEETKTVSVIIGLVNDETPRVTVNRGLRVQAGRCIGYRGVNRALLYTEFFIHILTKSASFYSQNMHPYTHKICIPLLKMLHQMKVKQVYTNSLL